LVCHTANQSMASNGTPQSGRFVFSLQSNGAAGEAVNAAVRQDKARIASARTGTRQPAPETKNTRARPVDSSRTRSTNQNGHKSRTEKLTAWVNPLVKSELQRLAAQEGLSLSAITAAFLEQALQHNVDMHYSALLEPIIISAIRKELQGNTDRLASLLVRNAFETNQTRALVTNILGRQPGMKEETLKTILSMTRNAAKGTLTQRSEEFAELIAAVKKFLDAEAHEQEGQRG
jgi:hypothetical protein